MATAIPFNKPFIAGKELYYIAQAVTYGNIGGDGHFTKKCAKILEETFGIHRVLMTPSCTAALEMAAMLCDIQPGDDTMTLTVVRCLWLLECLGAPIHWM